MDFDITTEHTAPELKQQLLDVSAVGVPQG